MNHLGPCPLPPFDPRYVYNPADENARYFLTGGLPRPDRASDGHDVCSYCGQKVPVQRVTTHVTAAPPVLMLAQHPCRTKVA